MLTWLAKKLADRIDIVKLANLVEVELVARLDERIESKFRTHAVRRFLKNRARIPSKILYGITGEQAPVSGPYYMKEDPQYRNTFREGDTSPHHKIGATKLQVTWIVDQPKEN